MWFSSSHNLPETEQEDKKGCPIMMAFLLHVEDVAEAADTSKTNTKQSSYFKWWYGGRRAKVTDKLVRDGLERSVKACSKKN